MLNPARVAVLVSGGGTNLQALIDRAAAGELPHAELALVISSRAGVFALERARRAGIPAEVADRKALGEGFEPRITALLDAYKIDLVVLAGFLSILSPAFTAARPRRILNVHPSLIPAFCGKGYYGLRVHEAALARGVKITGATVHYVNEIPDGGEILLQKAVEVAPDDTPETLQQRVMREAEWVILPRAVEMAARRITEGEAP